ncbi:MAG: M48 family metallopeptidase [Acidimicrobiia bacterium]|nr:M48 family metallopeptidase [Acidimicrobiia bacterium]
MIRSARRRKTAQARLIGSTIEIRIPGRCSGAEERELIEHFITKFERQRSTDGIDLTARAVQLANRFGLPHPSSIRWVTNQRCRWGSCTPADGTIRLSDRLAEYPAWVLDYVIVHELAHLVESGHTPAFWALVDGYPLGERAKGFLIAKGLDGD